VEILEHSHNIIFNNVPKFLKQKKGEAIRARGSLSITAEDI
jgi:hypothetical protein